MTKAAERFAKIFSGLARSSGRYVVPTGAKPNAEGKVLGRAWTAKAPVTLALWEDHLSGKPANVRNEETDEPMTGALGLGIVPIREDDTVVFGAFDVDVYPLDHKKLLADSKKLNLPVLICRTKSAGAHGYLFLKEPAPAALVRDKLTEWASALGYPGIEIFPKQVKLAAISDGSWINIPYSGGNRSVRYALKPDGSAMGVDEFLEAVDSVALTVEELRAFELPALADEDEMLRGAPPCLVALSQKGFGDWGNNGLFNVAVYLKKRFGDDWDTQIEKHNAAWAGLGLGPKDVATIVKSVKKKKYQYQCKNDPLHSVCNKTACLKRDFGVGGPSDPGVTYGELVKVLTDPVTWIFTVDGAEIECATSDLADQRKFRMTVMEKLTKWPNMIDPDEWAKMIRDRLERAKVVEVPVDGTREGQFWAHLANFCTGKARARTLDEILLGKAHTDLTGKAFKGAEAGRVYFRSTDFFAYLSAHRFSGFSERDAWRWLRKGGAEHHEMPLKRKITDFWSVAAFPEQTEEHDVPRAPSGPEM